MFARRRARGIEQARLRQQYEWTFVRKAAPRSAFGGGDLFHRAAKVHRGGSCALRRRPWNGAVERPVHLEYTRSVAVILQFAAIGFRQPVAGDAKQLPGRDVAKNRRVRRSPKRAASRAVSSRWCCAVSIASSRADEKCEPPPAAIIAAVNVRSGAPR